MYRPSKYFKISLEKPLKQLFSSHKRLIIYTRIVVYFRVFHSYTNTTSDMWP